MKFVKALAVCAGISYGFAASLATATPPVLDRVPRNAMAVIAVNSPEKLQKNISALAGAIQVPIPIPGVEDMLAQMGLEKGVDSTKSMAMVLLPVPADAKNVNGEPLTQDEIGEEIGKHAYFIVSASDYSQFIGNFSAASVDGVDTGSMQGEPAYFKNLGGGFAAMSPNKDVVQGLAADGGNQGAVDASLGVHGKRIADTADIVMIINVEAARAVAPDFGQILDQMGDNPAAFAASQMMGEGGDEFIRHMVDQSRTVTVGISPEALGVSVDVGMAFKEGSELAGMFAGEGAASSLTSKLPNQPYFLTVAVDASSPGMRKMVDSLAAKFPKDEQAGLPGMLLEQLKASDGGAFGIGAPAGGVMGGIFTGTIAYLRTSKPDGYIAAMKQGLTELNGQPMGPFSAQTSYTSDDGEVDGSKVDTYAVKFKPADEDNADPQMGMATMMMFGPAGGPAGYIAKVDGGIIQTMSKNSLLMGAALKAAKGGDNAGSDKLTAQIGERLPKNRLAEVYIGVKPILETALGLAAMSGANFEVDVPVNMPPIGMGMTGGGSGVHMGAYLPAPALKAIASLAMQASAMGGMGGGDDDAPPPPQDGGKPQPRRQPRF